MSLQTKGTEIHINALRYWIKMIDAINDKGFLVANSFKIQALLGRTVELNKHQKI